MAISYVRSVNISRTRSSGVKRSIPKESATRRGSCGLRGAAQMFLEAGHQLDQIAGPLPVVELVLDDVFPAVAAGAGRSGQREQIRPAGDAGGGAALDRRGTDLLIAEVAEQLAEAVDLLLVDGLEGLGRDVATRDAGPPGRNDDIDLRIGDPAPERGDDVTLIVPDDALGRDAVPRRLDQLDKRAAGFVGGFVAGVRDRQDRDVDGQEGARLIDFGRHGDRSARVDRERYRSAIDPQQAHRDPASIAAPASFRGRAADRCASPASPRSSAATRPARRYRRARRAAGCPGYGRP